MRYRDENAVDTILRILYRELQEEKEYWDNQYMDEDFDYDYINDLLSAYEFITRKHTTYLKRYANYETLKELVDSWQEKRKFDEER